MVLIFGGAYQGKLEYAKKNFYKQDEDVFFCSEEMALNLGTAGLDLSKDVIYGLENLVMASVKAGLEATEFLMQWRDSLADKIIIATDVSQGLVPMDKTDRDFREMMGRTLLYLSGQAEQVHRVFCGLGQRIK